METVEVLVSAEQDEVVLQDDRGNPQVIGGNRSSGLSQFGEEIGIDVYRRLVGKQNGHPIGSEESAEDVLVFPRLAAAAKAGAKLGEYDKRQAD